MQNNILTSLAMFLMWSSILFHLGIVEEHILLWGLIMSRAADLATWGVVAVAYIWFRLKGSDNPRKDSVLWMARE